MTILKNVSLKEYNTFHVDCTAKYFVRIEHPSDFITLMKTDERKTSHKKLFLGGGSNMLFTTPAFDGIVIYNNIQWIEKVADHPHEVFLNIGWGEDRDSFVRRTVENGLYGIENLVSIPGKVGTAPIQNIGAYGTDIGQMIVSVGGFNLQSHEYETLSHKECLFGYRDSIFKGERKNEFFITDVTLRLQHYDPDTYAPIATYGNISDALATQGITKPSPHDMMETIAQVRASKLPDRHKVGTWGSFFKNVILNKDEYDDFVARVHTVTPWLEVESHIIDDEFYKIPTGWILDHVLGYRGYREWNVGCREQQALCIVNYGWATGKEILDFARQIQKTCHDKLGISLEPEVNFVG